MLPLLDAAWLLPSNPWVPSLDAPGTLCSGAPCLVPNSGCPRGRGTVSTAPVSLVLWKVLLFVFLKPHRSWELEGLVIDYLVPPPVLILPTCDRRGAVCQVAVWHL